MNMRLIDADSFIEYANKRLDIFADELTGMINEQPTAYNVEKVVEELEGEKSKSIYDYDSVIDVKSAYSKAIDIVREGGVE